MSRIQLNIERLVISGFERGEANALAEALQSHLRQLLLDPANREQWARSHRTPVLKLGRLPVQAGAAGAGKFAGAMARAIARGLKP